MYFYSQMTNITYRVLYPADASAYRALRLEALQNNPNGFGTTYEEESIKPKLAFENYIEQQTPGKFIAGAFDGETLMGICGFAGDDTKRNRHKGTIIQMYVRPAYSGRRIGLALLQATMNAAFALPGVEQLVLGVVTANIRAVKVYEQAGFETLGTQRNYFKDEDGSYLHQQFMVLYKDGLDE
jgi:RimJ/RimL family protein N-acetyltransferase